MTSKFETDNETVNWTERASGTAGPTRRTSRADNKYSRFCANATLPRASAQLHARRALHEGRTGEQRRRRPDGAGHHGRCALGHGGFPAPDRPEHLELRRQGGQRDLHAGARLDADQGPGHAPLLQRLQARRQVHAHGVHQRAGARPHLLERAVLVRQAELGLRRVLPHQHAEPHRRAATTSSTWSARTRFDFDETEDKTWFVEWKTSMVDERQRRA